MQYKFVCCVCSFSSSRVSFFASTTRVGNFSTLNWCNGWSYTSLISSPLCFSNHTYTGRIDLDQVRRDSWLLGADAHQRSSCWTTDELISSTLSPVFSFVYMFSKYNVRGFPWNWCCWTVAIQILFVWRELLKCPLPLKKECIAIPSCPPFRYWHLQDSPVVHTTYHPVNGRQLQSLGCWISKQSKTAAIFLKIIDPIRWPVHHMYEKTHCHDCTELL